MAFFCQNMVELGARLSAFDPSYEDDVIQFVERYLWIARSINSTEEGGMWDEEDGFYYEMLELPDTSSKRLKVRSVFGLLPLCAVTVIEPWQREMAPIAVKTIYKLWEQNPELLETTHATGPGHYVFLDRGIIALVNETRLRRILTRVLDENEFLGPYGIRTLSKNHLEHPCLVEMNQKAFCIRYRPAVAESVIYGGNFNWQGVKPPTY